MKKFISQNRIFLSLYLIFLSGGGILLAVINKGDEVIWFNSLHSFLPDKFFAFVHLCLDTPPKNLFYIFAIVLFLSYGKGLLYFLTALLNAIGINIFQDYVFRDMPRPCVNFDGSAHLHFAQGVVLRSGSGFPSSYACHIFALCFVLSIFLYNKKWTYLLFSIAILAVITRVYLFQNFFSDMYFGSVLGMTSAIVINAGFAQSGLYKNIKWKDNSLLKDIKGFLDSLQKVKQPPI